MNDIRSHMTRRVMDWLRYYILPQKFSKPIAHIVRCNHFVSNLNITENGLQKLLRDDVKALCFHNIFKALKSGVKKFRIQPL